MSINRALICVYITHNLYDDDDDEGLSPINILERLPIGFEKGEHTHQHGSSFLAQAGRFLGLFALEETRQQIHQCCFDLTEACPKTFWPALLMVKQTKKKKKRFFFRYFSFY